MLLYLPTACIVGFHSRDLQKLTMITNATVQIIYTAQIEVNTNRMAVRDLFIIRKVYGQYGSGVRILIRLCIYEYYVGRDNVVSFH